jgi:hypothetical protein
MLVAENGGCMTVRAGTGPAVKPVRRSAITSSKAALIFWRRRFKARSVRVESSRVPNILFFQKPFSIPDLVEDKLFGIMR